MQCLRKYHDTKDFFPHIVNGLKYLTQIIAVIMTYVFPLNGIYWYITASFYVLTTLYSYIWDITMDWGLWWSWAPGKWGLWDTIYFPPCFYYIAMLINLILRSVWILSTSIINEHQIFGDFEGIYFLVSILEASWWA